MGGIRGQNDCRKVTQAFALSALNPTHRRTHLNQLQASSVMNRGSLQVDVGHVLRFAGSPSQMMSLAIQSNEEAPV
jgi:hypothetical protein